MLPLLKSHKHIGYPPLAVGHIPTTHPPLAVGHIPTTHPPLAVGHIPTTHPVSTGCPLTLGYTTLPLTSISWACSLGSSWASLSWASSSLFLSSKVFPSSAASWRSETHKENLRVRTLHQGTNSSEEATSELWLASFTLHCDDTPLNHQLLKACGCGVKLRTEGGDEVQMWNRSLYLVQYYRPWIFWQEKKVP